MMNISKLANSVTVLEISLVSFLSITFILGSLFGYQLIQQAKVEQLSYTLSQLSSAWYQFKDKYQALPGDYQFASTHIDFQLMDGNGNNKIDNYTERGQVWQHLSYSGLLPLHTDGGPVEFNALNCPPSRCMHNHYGYGFNISYGNLSQNSPDSTNQVLTGIGIPLDILRRFDQRYDDGLATRGRVQVAKPGQGWSQADMELCLDYEHYPKKGANIACSAIINIL